MAGFDREREPAGPGGPTVQQACATSVRAMQMADKQSNGAVVPYRDPYAGQAMLETGENVARHYGITTAEQRCQAASVPAERAGEGETAQTLHRLALAVDAQAQETEQAARTLAEARSADAEAPFRVADDALHAVGHALLAWAWARIALAAVTLAPAESQRERLDLCAFGVDWLLPAGQWRWRRISSWRTPLPWISGSTVHGG